MFIDFQGTVPTIIPEWKLKSCFLYFDIMFDVFGYLIMQALCLLFALYMLDVLWKQNIIIRS